MFLALVRWGAARLGLLRLFDKKGEGTVTFDALVNGLVGMSLGERWTQSMREHWNSRQQTPVLRLDDVDDKDSSLPMPCPDVRQVVMVVDVHHLQLADACRIGSICPLGVKVCTCGRIE